MWDHAGSTASYFAPSPLAGEGWGEGAAPRRLTRYRPALSLQASVRIVAAGGHIEVSDFGQGG